MTGKTALTNARIISMDAEHTQTECLIIENGKISCLGRSAEVSPMIDQYTNVYDLGGKTVLPGFVDTHVHLVMTGLRSQQLELQDTKSFDHIIDKIRDWNTKHPGDDWICGWGVNDLNLKEGRMPRSEDLDRCGINRPIWIIRMDGNSCAVNTAGLSRLSFSKDDISVLKDDSGEPSGVFKVPANFSVRLQVLNSVGPDVKRAAVEWAAKSASQQGLTFLHPMEYPEDISIVQEIEERLPVKLHLYPRTDDWRLVLNKGFNSLGGDILLDGTFGCYSAALSRPYADNPSESGTLYYRNNEAYLLECIEVSKRKGLQTAFHSIGDAAIEMHLNLFEKVFGSSPDKPIKHRIEHYVLPSSDHIERTARLGVMASVAPEAVHNCLEGGIYSIRLGPERLHQALPLRKMFDAGIIVSGNSDSPVYNINPLVGISEAITAPLETQRLTLSEAIEMYTINGAKLALKEDIQGSLEPGKCADLVVLEENPYEVAPAHIKNIKVAMTFLDGTLQFNS